MLFELELQSLLDGVLRCRAAGGRKTGWVVGDITTVAGVAVFVLVPLPFSRLANPKIA